MKKHASIIGIVAFVGILIIGVVGYSNIGRTGTNTESITSDSSSAASGRYETYDASKLALAKTGKVVLFFKADWCSTCRALDADIRRNLRALPPDLTILRLNYDTELALRRKYGVTIQHTLVQVDSNGNLITKWSGGNTLATVLARLR